MKDTSYSIDNLSIKEEFLNRISIEEENNKKIKIIKNLEINNYSNEKLGMILALLSTFCGSFGSFYTKLIQRTYPNDFHVVQFLFLRCFTLFFLTLFHCKITLLL